MSTVSRSASPISEPSLSIQARYLTGGVAVPEPMTWALMLSGFAALGAALRGRRARALAAA